MTIIIKPPRGDFSPPERKWREWITRLLTSGTDPGHSHSTSVGSTFEGDGYGSNYTVTESSHLFDQGGGDPSLVLTAAGTYLLLAHVNSSYSGATFAATRTFTMYLYRANNTPTSLSNALQYAVPVMTTYTGPAFVGMLPAVIYTTVNDDDQMEIWGYIDTAPTAGALNVTRTIIQAIRLV